MSELPPVVYILASCGPCGGVKVALEHVWRLGQRGHPAEVWHLGGPPRWFGRRLPCRAFSGTDALGAAMREHKGWLVATWWETAEWVASSRAERTRLGYLVQDIESSYARNQSESDRILRTYRLGLTHICDAVWVEQQLAQMGTPGTKVGIGIDHQTFRPLPMLRERNRVLCQWRTGGAGNDMKGTRYLTRLVTLIRRRHPEVEFVTFGREAGPKLPRGVPHIHLTGPSDQKLRELYCQCGVFLYPSRHEGFGLLQLEAYACAAPVACFDANGNREMVRHGETCLMALQGDVGPLADHVATLLRDQALADRLGRAGRELALTYQWDAVTDRLLQVFGD